MFCSFEIARGSEIQNLDWFIQIRFHQYLNRTS